MRGPFTVQYLALMNSKVARLCGAHWTAKDLPDVPTRERKGFRTTRTKKMFSPELRTGAVRMVQDHQTVHSLPWAITPARTSRRGYRFSYATWQAPICLAGRQQNGQETRARRTMLPPGRKLDFSELSPQSVHPIRCGDSHWNFVFLGEMVKGDASGSREQCGRLGRPLPRLWCRAS